MPRPTWTVEQARLAGQRSAQLRAERKANPKPDPQLTIVEALPNSIPTQDPLAQNFTRAIVDTLERYLAADDYKEKAGLARSMREVRETYHLWSGTPKPGVRKPERTSSRAPTNQQAGPELPGDTTTGSVPTGQ